MNDEHVQEFLEAYILGALDAETQARVEKHLNECADCHHLADEYAEIVNRLPEAIAAASPLRPPDFVKVRLMQSVETSDKAAHSLPIDQKRGREKTRSWQPLRFQQFASVAILLLLIFSFAWIAHLSTALAHEQVLRENLEQQTELIFEVVDSDQTTKRFLRATEDAPIMPGLAPPYGKVFTRADLPYVVAMTGRLPQPPAGQVYNLWLFRDGSAELAGALPPDDAGFSALVVEASENGPVYEAAQLILQNTGSDTPSGTPVLIWHLEGEA